MALFKPAKRCPYCAHKLRADGTCRNTECVIGYVPDKTKDMSDVSNTNEKTEETPKMESK